MSFVSFSSRHSRPQLPACLSFSIPLLGSHNVPGTVWMTFLILASHQAWVLSSAAVNAKMQMEAPRRWSEACRALPCCCPSRVWACHPGSSQVSLSLAFLNSPSALCPSPPNYPNHQPPQIYFFPHCQYLPPRLAQQLFTHLFESLSHAKTEELSCSIDVGLVWAKLDTDPLPVYNSPFHVVTTLLPACLSSALSSPSIIWIDYSPSSLCCWKESIWSANRIWYLCIT